MEDTVSTSDATASHPLTKYRDVHHLLHNKSNISSSSLLCVSSCYRVMKPVIQELLACVASLSMSASQKPIVSSATSTTILLHSKILEGAIQTLFSIDEGIWRYCDDGSLEGGAAATANDGDDTHFDIRCSGVVYVTLLGEAIDTCVDVLSSNEHYSQQHPSLSTSLTKQLHDFLFHCLMNLATWNDILSLFPLHYRDHQSSIQVKNDYHPNIKNIQTTIEEDSNAVLGVNGLYKSSINRNCYDKDISQIERININCINHTGGDNENINSSSDCWDETQATFTQQKFDFLYRWMVQHCCFKSNNSLHSTTVENSDSSKEYNHYYATKQRSDQTNYNFPNNAFQVVATAFRQYMERTMTILVVTQDTMYLSALEQKFTSRAIQEQRFIDHHYHKQDRSTENERKQQFHKRLEQQNQHQQQFTTRASDQDDEDEL
eukprot:CAMPEP_0194410892 /NCGR_PEP_ID=MMETSP0176-20130528/9037_1 /TAXON_ID=216777 /ORGANISM="Proboscia alata, Strain PI-D3" /LENGTH=432 /DNA_ID=CAMNT_0039212527 /DNA_START=62 /DNA_END=1360 /DNA_ORIENTATION=+